MSAIGNFISRFAIQIVSNLVLIFGVLGFVCYEEWRAGAILSIFVFATLFVLVGFRNIGLPHWEAVRQTSSEVFGFLEERLAGAEDINTSSAKPYVLRRFFELSRLWLRRTVKSSLMTNILFNSSEIMFAAGNATALAVGAYFYSQGQFSIGTVYLLFHYTNMLIQPVHRITSELEDLQRAGAAVYRIVELKKKKGSITDNAGKTISMVPPSVEFHRVSFAYEPNNVTLSNITFRVEPGRVLGLIGRTGSGKTTLTRLILRLYDPDAGHIELGGKDIKELKISDLRRHVVLVPQNVHLFKDNIRSNLTLYNTDISDEMIWRTLHSLGLSRWVESLESGLDTQLEGTNGGLSAGEMQLIALGRVFLKTQPELVILDEASSRVDPPTQSYIKDTLEMLLEGKTAIIIAHRLESVRNADDILILEKGKLLEFGKRVELERDPSSKFNQLLQDNKVGA